MRELKFRVWDKMKKCFIPNNVYAILNLTSFNSFGIMIRDWEEYREGEYFYDNAQELKQFTGLKDKNGVEIFEGDVIQHDDKKHYIVEWPLNFGGMWLLSTIKYDNGPHGMGFEETEQYEIEVIGNICENPELL